jgi:hypothetical protein
MQTLSDLSPAGLMTTFYCLGFETPPTWRARSPYLYPQKQGGPVIHPATGYGLGIRPRLHKVLNRQFLLNSI